jgi:hypothetical protein
MYAMTSPHPRLRSASIGGALSAAVLFAACTGGPTATGVDEPLPSAVEATRDPDEPSPPAASSAATPTPSSPPATMTQSETEWGRIWDGLPKSFPTIPGATLSEEAGSDGPVSATFSVPGSDPAEIAGLLQTELEIATYSTEALSGPLEDGSFVIDSVGEGDCRIETSVRPAGDTILVAVRYGAACPAN